MSTEDAAPVVDTGISTETHKKVADELADAQRQLAVLKAKTDVYDAQKREALSGMKSDVSGFINEIAGAEEFAAYKHEIAPMCRWASEMENGDALDTNLSIGRLVSCASAKFKRTREEASEFAEKSTLLSETMKELEAVKADRDSKLGRITELEGLVDERTSAATKLQDELAKAGLMQEKIDFSKKAARENTVDAVASPSSGAGSSSRSAISMDDALLGFINNGPKNGGLKIGQSATGHSFLGGTGEGRLY